MADIVITGACGHLGSALIRALLARGDSLTLIDNLSTQKHCSLYGLKGDWNLIEASVHEVPQEVFRNKKVIHLAAIAEPQTSIKEPQFVLQHNTHATKHIVSSEPAHLIFASSAGIYGPQLEPISDDFVDIRQYKPQTPYARAKLTEECMIGGLLPSYTIFRMGTLFGPSPGMRFHTAVNKFCWQAFTGQAITVWKGAYKARRPYLDIVDAVNAFISPAPSRVYNLLTCNATVEDVLLAIQEHIPRVDIELIDGPVGMDQSSYEIGDHSTPVAIRSTLQAGISRTMSQLL